MPSIRPITPFIAALSLALAVLGSEALFWTWRQWRWQPATGPFYSWPQAFALPPASPDTLRTARQLIRPDRASNPLLTIAPGRVITAFYFEWDSETGSPARTLSGHDPEICDTAQGFQLVAKCPRRVWDGPAGPVEFETTELLSPDGRVVFVFKNIWFRAAGNWNMRDVQPWERLNVVLRPRSGEVRLLQAGVFGISSEESAWQVFIDHVLTQLVWSGSDAPPA